MTYLLSRAASPIMTEIRVGTPNIKSEAFSHQANIQMQGFAAGDVEPGAGMAGLLSRSVGAKDPGAGAGANPRRFLSSSVRSEPDLDTIMPLTSSYSHAQSSRGSPSRNWSGKTSRRDGAAGTGAGARGHAEGSDDSSEEDTDAERSLLYSPRSSSGFTNVEVLLV